MLPREHKIGGHNLKKGGFIAILSVSMTAQDKLSIYNLLKKTVSFECGYTPAVFTADTPVFADDAPTPPQSETPTVSFHVPEENQLAPSTILGENVNAKMSAALAASALLQPQAQPVSPQPEAVFSETTPRSTGEGQPPAVSHGEMSETLESVAALVKDCRNCRLAEKRTNTVFGEGVAKPLVLVVGEGPGHDEDVTGRPFVGAAGQLLDKMLSAISLFRATNCYIANVVKCRPPANRTPEADECAICRKYLDSQIKILKPTLILALGNTAMQALTGYSGITKLHGIFFMVNGIPVMPTYHPSALLRDVSKKRDAWEDLKVFRRRLVAFVGEYGQRPS